jgi:hypothetical protein
MDVQRFSKQAAKQLWETWLAGQPVAECPNLSKDERSFRGKLIEHAERAGGCSDPAIDIPIALELYYRLLPLCAGHFTLGMASDDGIWRSLTMRVIPDYVAKRWGIKQTKSNGEIVEQSSHFWSQPQRNWLKALWWYCHFADRGDADEASSEGLLRSIQSHSDAIQGLVERPGRKGFDVALNRELLSRLTNKTMTVDKFKELLKINTAASRLTVPALCDGGAAGYVDSLILKLES